MSQFLKIPQLIQKMCVSSVGGSQRTASSQPLFSASSNSLFLRSHPSGANLTERHLITPKLTGFNLSFINTSQGDTQYEEVDDFEALMILFLGIHIKEP